MNSYLIISYGPISTYETRLRRSVPSEVGHGHGRGRRRARRLLVTRKRWVRALSHADRVSDNRRTGRLIPAPATAEVARPPARARMQVRFSGNTDFLRGTLVHDINLIAKNHTRFYAVAFHSVKCVIALRYFDFLKVSIEVL